MVKADLIAALGRVMFDYDVPCCVGTYFDRKLLKILSLCLALRAPTTNNQ